MSSALNTFNLYIAPLLEAYTFTNSGLSPKKVIQLEKANERYDKNWGIKTINRQATPEYATDNSVISWMVSGDIEIYHTDPSTLTLMAKDIIAFLSSYTHTLDGIDQREVKRNKSRMTFSVSILLC